MRFLLGLLIALVSIGVCSAEVVVINPGSQGDVQASRLYSIDYNCAVKPNSLDTVENALGRIKAHLTSGTLSNIVTIYQQSPASAPGSALAATDVVFATTVMAQDYALGLQRTPQEVFSGCRGQFFVNGSSNYIIQADITVNSTNVLSDALSKGATLLKSAVSMGYALFSKNPVPPEFSKTVTDTSQLITDYAAFKTLFETSKDFKGTKNAKLRVGTNTVLTYDADESVTSVVTLTVRPVVSLVADGHTKFIAAYNASSTNQPLDLTAVAFGDLQRNCSFEVQKYYNVGIVDDRDIAYLLYRRILLANNERQKIAQCMGTRASRAALIIMKYLPTVADDYKITLDDVKNIVTETTSHQPFARPTLAKDIDLFLDTIARDMQTPDGLRGDDLSALKAHLSSSIDVRDTTTGYEIMSLVFGDNINNRKLVTVDDLRSSLRKAGLKRWLCAQATKKDKDTSLPLYDPTIGSAVIAIVAKGERADALDYNKTKLFGIHLLFAKAFNSDPLVLTQIIFEDRLRDVVLKANSACVANTPGAPQR